MAKRNCKQQKEQTPAAMPWRFQPGQSGNPAGRPVGAVNQVLREAREAAHSIALPMLVDAAKGGDLFAARTLLQLGLPKLRPVSLPEPVALPEGTLTDKATAIIEQVASGAISAQTGAEMASIIATAGKIEELTELRQRIDALDEKIKELLDSRP